METGNSEVMLKAFTQRSGCYEGVAAKRRKAGKKSREELDSFLPLKIEKNDLEKSEKAKAVPRVNVSKENKKHPRKPEGSTLEQTNFMLVAPLHKKSKQLADELGMTKTELFRRAVLVAINDPEVLSRADELEADYRNALGPNGWNVPTAE